ERIVNHRGWPLPKLSVEKRAQDSQVSTIVPVPRPPDVDEKLHPDLVDEPPAFFPGDMSPEQRYGWARGMTGMRSYQADRTKSGVIARIALGGVFDKTVQV